MIDNMFSYMGHCYDCIHLYMTHMESISFRFSENSEAFASEFRENLEGICFWNHMYSDHVTN